jgi:hypothetical protein
MHSRRMVFSTISAGFCNATLRLCSSEKTVLSIFGEIIPIVESFHIFASHSFQFGSDNLYCVVCDPSSSNGFERIP